LHFAFAYGYHELGKYLLSLGADDTVANMHGMTCYEGLDPDEPQRDCLNTGEMRGLAKERRASTAGGVDAARRGCRFIFRPRDHAPARPTQRHSGSRTGQRRASDREGRGELGRLGRVDGSVRLLGSLRRGALYPSRRWIRTVTRRTPTRAPVRRTTRARTRVPT
jgi:hypothetical protein